MAIRNQSILQQQKPKEDDERLVWDDIDIEMHKQIN